MWLQIILLSVSFSIDALGIGVSYALRGVRIDIRAKAAVGVITAVIMGAAVAAGESLGRLFPESAVSLAGAGLLIVMGGFLLFRNLFPGKETEFDRDSSRHIDVREGILLGAALSVDSVSAGIAAAATGINGLFLAPAVGMMQTILLIAGECMICRWGIGRRMNQRVCMQVSGALLILIGIVRLCV